ncbi:MAG: ABC transporter ATP-binding protein [Candidatus Wenzhouxiangella sp. M2_3B_020]
MSDRGAALVLQGFAAGTLAALDLRIEAGEIVGLAGPSGSGKTRLLRAVADLEPHDGSADLGDLRRDAIPAHEWRRRVMLVPAESRWWHDRVGAHFPAGTASLPDALGLPDEALGWSVDRLSSGEKQRLALFRALALEPRALLLDEPTANLDAKSIARIEDWLRGVVRERGLPALWVAHDADQLDRVAERRLNIVDGRLEQS